MWKPVIPMMTTKDPSSTMVLRYQGDWLFLLASCGSSQTADTYQNIGLRITTTQKTSAACARSQSFGINMEKTASSRITATSKTARSSNQSAAAEGGN